MNALLTTLIAGLLGTAAMSAFLYLIHWRGFANADMIRAVGSLFTRDEQGSMVPGLLLHACAGLAFAFVYIALWSSLPFAAEALTAGRYVTLGLITGAGHGLVVSFMLVVLVAEHHPLQRFQQAGLGVAVAHWLAHLVYGAVVGAVAGGLIGGAALRYGFVPMLGQ